MGRYDTDDDVAVDSGKESSSVDRKVIGRGWGTAKAVKEEGSPFAQRVKFEGDEPVVLKFLEDDPYTSYHQHWIERSGQKSWTCIKRLNERGCPLCDAGDRPAARFGFNVAELTDGEPTNRSWEVGPRLIDTISNFHNSPRTGPLTKHYVAVTRTGKGPTTQYNLQMVKADDLEELYGVKPLTEAQIEKLSKNVYDESIVAVPTYKQLEDVADEV